MLVKKYILKSIGEMFFPFFFVLFFLSSFILLLNIAVLTNGVRLSVSDLLRLYYYGIPANTFFVVALTFYNACILGLSRLSYDSEMLVCFSLGISPTRIIYFLLPLCCMVSFVLFMFSFVMTPASKNAYRDFIAYKANQIDIDLRPGDFGQKINDWLVYVDAKNGDAYSGLVIYANESSQSQENFITAREGRFFNKNGVIELKLYDGMAYFSDGHSLQNVRFKEMVVRNSLKDSNFSSQDLLSYWGLALKGDEKQLKRLSQSFCTSLFPLVSIFFMLFFGIKNPRFHKNYAYFYVLGSGGAYLLIMYIWSLQFPLSSLAFPFIWLFIGYYLYAKYVRRYY